MQVRLSSFFNSTPSAGGDQNHLTGIGIGLSVHRIYLGSGIYGEATLMFHHSSFQPHDYTYPDYRWPETLSYFGTLGSIYMEQLKLGRKC